MSFRNKLIKVYGADPFGGASWQAHHIIPNVLTNAHDQWLKDIGFGGINDASNGIALPTDTATALDFGVAKHSGSHVSSYTTQVNATLVAIKNRFDVDSDAKAALREALLHKSFSIGFTV